MITGMRGCVAYNDIWPWPIPSRSTKGHLFYATSSFVHYFVATGGFKLELQSGNAQSGSNSAIVRAVWPWNVTDDLETQSLFHFIAILVSNWSYGPETAKWGHDLCDLDLWLWPFAWTSRLWMVITPENFKMIRWQENCQKGVADRRRDGRTDGRTEIGVLRADWSQLKINSLALL